MASVLVKEYKLSQLRVAKLLGMKQPSVNYVVTGRRRAKYSDLVERLPGLRHLLDEVVKDVYYGLVFNPCELCGKLVSNSELLRDIMEYFGGDINLGCLRVLNPRN